MGNVDELFEMIGGLNLPRTEFIVAGSAPLLIHGLRHAIQDLDIVASGSIWKSLRLQHNVSLAPFDRVHKVDLYDERLPVEILNGWFPHLMGWSVDYLIGQAEVAHGINFVPLELTLDWKLQLNRSKDAEDVQRIKDFLNASHG